MKTPHQILKEIAGRENLFGKPTWEALININPYNVVEALTIEAMESYASQAVEAERKRIRDEVKRMIAGLEAETSDTHDFILDCIQPKTETNETD